MKHRNALTSAILALVLLAAACGSDDPGDAVEESTDELAEALESGDQDAATDAIDDLVDDLEDQQASQGGGSASLTVGEETYSFDSVRCAFGEEETGQEGAEFVLSAIADGTQLYFTIDRFGHSVSLDDIEDFENPSVGLRSQGEDFIELDGRSASGEVEFVDSTGDGLNMERVLGTFEGTCP